MHTFQDDAGKKFVATVNGNTLTMYVPRGPSVTMKIPPKHKSKLGHAIKRTDFHAFAKVVDMVEG